MSTGAARPLFHALRFAGGMPYLLHQPETAHTTDSCFLPPPSSSSTPLKAS